MFSALQTNTVMSDEQNSGKQTWSQDNIVELLACLDFLVWLTGSKPDLGNDDAAELNKQHILSSLHKTLSGDHTREEIEKKLYQIYREGDKNAEWNFQKVFYFGSYEMHSLDKDMKRKVLDTFKNLQMTAPRQRRIVFQNQGAQDKVKRRKLVQKEKPARAVPRKLDAKAACLVLLPRSHALHKVFIVQENAHFQDFWMTDREDRAAQTGRKSLCKPEKQFLQNPYHNQARALQESQQPTRRHAMASNRENGCRCRKPMCYRTPSLHIPVSESSMTRIDIPPGLLARYQFQGRYTTICLPTWHTFVKRIEA